MITNKQTKETPYKKGKEAINRLRNRIGYSQKEQERQVGLATVGSANELPSDKKQIKDYVLRNKDELTFTGKQLKQWKVEIEKPLLLGLEKLQDYDTSKIKQAKEQGRKDAIDEMKKENKYFTMYCLICKRKTVHVGIKEDKITKEMKE